MEIVKQMTTKVKMTILGLIALVTGFLTVKKFATIPPPPDESKATEIKESSRQQIEQLVEQVEQEAAARKLEAEEEAEAAEREAVKESKAEEAKLAEQAKNKPEEFSKKIERELGLKKSKRPYKKRK
jgi:membrane protein involved in colicin uptake